MPIKPEHLKKSVQYHALDHTAGNETNHVYPMPHQFFIPVVSQHSFQSSHYRNTQRRKMFDLNAPEARVARTQLY